MSFKCMPLLFLNMGSEMLYILQLRLTVQNIAKNKAMQVLQDISHILFNTKFLKELFKPQYICNKSILRIYFEKLAHSSIIRLDRTSMNKLYVLMMMTYKYQLQLCNGPENIVFITLNHLDCIRKILPNDEKLNKFLDIAHQMVVENYHEIPHWEKAMIRSCLLNFFQDLQMNISVFVRENKQTEDGRFILFPDSNYQLLYNGIAPGTIRYFDIDGTFESHSFRPDDDTIIYKSCKSTGNVELNASDRSTKLGTNMYMSSACLQVKTDENIPKLEASLQGDELRLLSALIITPGQDQQKGFDLNLFPDETDEQILQQQKYHDNATATIKTTYIDARKCHKTITAAIADLKMDESMRESKKGEEMLNLLDEITMTSDI